MATVRVTNALASVINVLGSTIKGYELENQWEHRNLKFINVIIQLRSLQAVLVKINRWVDTESLYEDHQLANDLNGLLHCCKALMGALDARLSELRRTEGQNPGQARNSETIAFQSENDLRKVAERQTKAFALILRACNCKSLPEKDTLLARSSTRRIFKRVEVDSASLTVRYEKISLLNQISYGVIKLSVFLKFISMLITSITYEHAIPGSLKKLVRMIKAKRRSKEIDQRLKKEMRQNREYTFLLGGLPHVGEETVMKQLRLMFQNGFSAAELAIFRSAIYRNIILSVEALIRAMEDFRIYPEQEVNRGYREFLANYLLNDQREELFDAKVGDAISSIWNDPCIPKLMEHRSESYLTNEAPYFFDEVKRIAAPDYVPQEADLLRARSSRPTISQARIPMGQLTINLFNIGTVTTRKQVHRIVDKASAFICVVDLGCYDQCIFEPSKSMMEEALESFDSIVNSSWARGISIILLLINISVFKEKLVRSSFQTYFPDYHGGDECAEAMKYLFGRFNQVNRSNLDMYHQVVDRIDSSAMVFIVAAIKQCIIHNALRSSGIL